MDRVEIDISCYTWLMTLTPSARNKIWNQLADGQHVLVWDAEMREGHVKPKEKLS